MSGKFKEILKSSVGLGVSTILSKVLGVVRDMLVAAIFGTSSAGGAWQLALVAPNMFRRILGEGAVGTAMVPLLADSVVQRQNREYAALQLRTILLTVGSILLAIVALGMVAPVLYSLTFTDETSIDTIYTCIAIPYAMPYAFFICLAGVATSALNVTKNFFWPSITGLFFNITTIVVILVYLLFDLNWSDITLLVLMCSSVTLSGVLQMICLLFLLRKEGLLAPRYYWNLPWKETLSSLLKLSFPALIGASALQISMTIDWCLAKMVGNYAVAALSYAEHISFLPISAVALSLGVVGLAQMTLAVSAGQMDEMKRIYNFAMRYVLFLSIPMAVFIFVFGEGIISVLFQRGKFDAQSVQETLIPLRYLAIAVPFFCMTKITVTGFHSRKEMRTPMYISILSNVINIIGAIILMQFLDHGGIALAMGVSSIFYNVVMIIIVHRQIGSFEFSKVIRSCCRSLLCAGLSILPIFYLYDMIPRYQPFAKLSGEFLPLMVAGVLFCLIYAILGIVFKSEEIAPLMRRFKRQAKGVA